MQSFKAGKIIKHVTRRATQSLLVAGVLAATSQFAHAGAEFKIGDDASLSLGIGLRTSYTSTQNGAPNGSSSSNNFAVENARIYMGGSYGKIVKATMNFNASGGTGTAAAGSDGLRLIDGIARFEFSPEFNIWTGRMLPPSDRANLYGPFFTAAWAFPGVAQNYPQATAGRDTGAMIWGDPMGGKLSYSFGIFNGHNRSAGLSNQSNNVLYAGRLEANFWSPQTGYYRDGTYFGSKDVLSLAIAGFSQSSGVGSAAVPGNLSVWSADGFFEKKLDNGFVPTLEAIYYRYDLGAPDCGSGEPGAPACVGGGDNVGGQVGGKAYIFTGALLIPEKVALGQFQPFLRYQKYNRQLSQTSSTAAEFGLNYIIKGPNAKISAVYTKFEDTRNPIATSKMNQFVLGAQLQY